MYLLYIYILPVLYLLGIKLCQRYKPYFLLSYKRSYNYYMMCSSLINFTAMFIYILTTHKSNSFHSLLCDKNSINNIYFYISQVVFFSSKYIEWIDTVYLILQNKPLTFLHVFHHLSTGVLTYLNTYPEPNAFWPIPCLTNTFVHFIMYSYYNGFFKNYKSYITKLQILQHGLILISSVYITIGYKYTIYNYCYNSLLPIIIAGIGYSVYFILFIKFYISSYK